LPKRTGTPPRRGGLSVAAEAACEGDLPDSASGPAPGVVDDAQETATDGAGFRSEPALKLLDDLRRLYLAASENSLYWEMLAQLAQATKDDRLLELASACHPQTLRQIRWANTMIKTLSPQALTST
jgi:hypothetical protein